MAGGKCARSPWLLVLGIVLLSLSLARAQVCQPDGNVDQDAEVSFRDVVLTLQHFLGIADPPLDTCAQTRANVVDPTGSAITPADARCIVQRVLGQPSCLDNAPPVLDPIGDQQVILGTTLQFQITATDPDGDPLAITVQPLPLPPHVAFDPTTRQFTFTPQPEQVGDLTLTFAVSDGEASVAETLTITVLPGSGVTALVGVVLTTDSAPLPGVRLEVAGRETRSGADGTFRLRDLPPGPQRLLIDGSTVNPVRGTFATVPEVVTLMAGTDNVLRAPIFLLPLDVASADPIDPAQDSVITSSPVTINGTTFPPVRMMVPAGTARREDTGELFAGMVHISQIPAPELGPMPLPADIDLSVYIAVQPFGVRYDPPIEIAFPNVENFPVGAIVDIFGLNHDTGVFEKVGEGQVRADGMVHSIGGVVRNNSWHGFVPQPPLGGPQPDPGPPCPDDCREPIGSSSVDPRTGDLSVEHDLVAYHSQGSRRALRLEYHSTTAFPRPVVSALVTTGNLTPPPLFMASEVVTAGVSQGQLVSEGPPFCPLNCPFARQAQPVDATTFSTGVYPAAITIHCQFPVSRRSRTFTQEVVVVNALQSPFGVGWGLQGLQRLHRTAAGVLLLTHGDDSALVFSPAVQAAAEIAASGERDRYQFAGNRDDVVTIRMQRRTNQGDGSGTLDPVVELLSSAGVLLVRDDDSGANIPNGPGNNALIGSFVLPATDTYTIIAASKGATQGPYDLFLTTTAGTTLVEVSDAPAATITNTVLSPPGDFSTLELNEDGSFSRRLKDGTIITFNARGLQTALSDRNGNTTGYTYDAANRLIAIEDPAGLVTTLRYVGALLSAIEDPAGLVTRFVHDTTGNLIQITDPDGTTHAFTYDARHLMRSQTNKRGLVTQYEYDFTGRLVRTALPDGSERSLVANHSLGLVDPASGLGTVDNPAPVVRAEEIASTLRDGEGRTTIFETGETGDVTRIIDAAGLTTQIDRDAAGNPIRLTLPSGVTQTATYDDRGNLRTSTDETLDGTVNFTYEPRFNRVISLTDTHGQTTTVDRDANGNPSRYTSPSDRTTVTSHDRRGLMETLTDFLGTSTTFTYDANGNVIEVVEGSGPDQRVVSLTYTPQGYPSTITNPVGQIFRFTYDPFGRVTSQTFPDGRVASHTYDANGNLSSVTPPGRPAHTFAHTPLDQLAAYTPPDVGARTNQTSYTYNAARQLTRITRPDGQTIDFGYDRAGRLSTRTLPRGQVTLAYDPTTGQLTTSTSPDGITLSHRYNGELAINTTWDGDIAGSMSRTFDSDLRVTSMSVNGDNTISFEYDADGLLTRAGEIILRLDPRSDLITGTTLGNVTDIRSYNDFGNLEAYRAAFRGTDLYAVQYTLDRLGRITAKTETIAGVTDTFRYMYDVAGRLSAVSQNGTTIATYRYDSNGNRLRFTGTAGPVTGTYDDQDRQLRYSTATYTYTANGELRSTTDRGETTTYAYDVLGNLLEVGFPNGTSIQYLIDGQNRRVGKRVNGILVQGLLYQDQFNPVAELDGAGNLVTRFVYATRSHVPDYMVREGTTYRILSDHLGSVRLVMNVATGAIAQRLDYDAFGQVLRDTNPGFQPFGFAGGLYDADTGLVRFGVRDYDPEVGRWTAKDPTGFRGGNTNLYGYLSNDPLNQLDPTGKSPFLRILQAFLIWFCSQYPEKCSGRPTEPPRFPPPEPTPPPIERPCDPERPPRPQRPPPPERPPLPEGEPERPPQPQGEPEGPLQPDERNFFEEFADEISALTGLTGAALITYIIISEGSRIVIPPRNLIPVP